MNLFTPTMYFDQNKESQLPRKTIHIVRSCAARASSGVLTERARQLTEAMMLMKLYQAYGNESRRYSARALELLRSMLGGTTTVEGSTREASPQTIAHPA